LVGAGLGLKKDATPYGSVLEQLRDAAFASADILSFASLPKNIAEHIDAYSTRNTLGRGIAYPPKRNFGGKQQPIDPVTKRFMRNDMNQFFKPYDPLMESEKIADELGLAPQLATATQFANSPEGLIPPPGGSTLCNGKKSTKSP